MYNLTSRSRRIGVEGVYCLPPSAPVRIAAETQSGSVLKQERYAQALRGVWSFRGKCLGDLVQMRQQIRQGFVVHTAADVGEARDSRVAFRNRLESQGAIIVGLDRVEF